MRDNSSNTERQPPRWDLTSIYPGLDSDDYKNAKQDLSNLTAAARKVVGDKATRDRDPAAWLVETIEAINLLRSRFESLYAYAYVNYSVDTTDPLAAQEIGALEEAALPLKRVETEFRNNLADIATDFSALCTSRPELAEYELFYREELELQQHQMSPEMEDLAADLSRSGGEAWSRLQSSVSSTLERVWNRETGERKTVTQLRTLAFSPDRETRKRAFELELEAWQEMEIPLSHALNGVKGFTDTLNKRRNYATTLERSLKQSRITPAVLSALIDAMEESLPAFRRYLKTKARLLGVEKLAFYDLFAPVGEGEPKEWSFAEASSFISTHFGAFTEDLKAYADKAFAQAWIDAEPRSGKVGGAYCISFPEQGESRILANFAGSSRDVSTLAHELGHGYHHHLVKDLSPIHQDYPMTLAETASIFAETLVTDKALQLLDGAARLEFLEASLQDSTQVIVDILSRFYFESELMQRRGDHELSPNELCEMMRVAQKRSYGDALDPEGLHPYMWAVKGHYYRQDLAFYNFPYAFGLLFGLGLYGAYLETPGDFPRHYREVLEATGKLDAVELTRRSGFDIETKEFWQSGLAVIAGQIEQFENDAKEFEA